MINTVRVSRLKSGQVAHEKMCNSSQIKIVKIPTLKLLKYTFSTQLDYGQFSQRQSSHCSQLKKRHPVKHIVLSQPNSKKCQKLIEEGLLTQKF